MGDVIKRYRFSILLILMTLIDESFMQDVISGDPVITNLPKVVVIGDKYTATCTAVGGNPKPVLTWYKDNVAISSSTPSPSASDQQLVLEFVAEESDKGVTFKCESENKVGTVSASAIINEVWARPFIHSTITPSAATIVTGSKYNWTCRVDNGYPVPDVDWTVLGKTYDKSSNLVEQFPVPTGSLPYNVTSVFTLNPVTSDYNNQVLTCKVKKTFSLANSPELSASITLNVHVKPTGAVSLISPTSNEGQSVNLKCTVTSSLSHTVQWRYQRTGSQTETNIQASSKYTLTSDTLTVSNLVHTDDGEYICRVSNSAGFSDSAPYHLIVYTKPAKPSITSSTNVINEGQTIDATCRATANPQTSVQYRWTIGSTVVVNTAQLIIKNADRTKAGNYICTATTPAGSTLSDPVKIDIHYTPAKLNNLQTEFSGPATNAVTLNCGTDAEPVPSTYTWTKNGVEDRSVTSRTYQTTIDDSTATYTCTATNTVGTSLPITFNVIPTDGGNAPNGGGASTVGGTGLSSAAIAAIVLAIIFIILVIIVIIVCCVSHGVCGTKKVTKKVKPQASTRRVERHQPTYNNEYLEPYDFTKQRAPHRDPATISRSQVEVDVPHYHNGYPKHSRGTHRSNFYRNAPPIAVESENGTIISVNGNDKDHLVSGKFGQLPPLDNNYTYYKEEELRKKRRKKKKRQQQEREAGVGQESPRREKRRRRRHENQPPATNGIPPQDFNAPPTTNGMPPGDININ